MSEPKTRDITIKNVKVDIIDRFKARIDLDNSRSEGIKVTGHDVMLELIHRYANWVSMGLPFPSPEKMKTMKHIKCPEEIKAEARYEKFREKRMAQIQKAKDKPISPTNKEKHALEFQRLAFFISGDTWKEIIRRSNAQDRKPHQLMMDTLRQEFIPLKK